jgi:integrase/recombinase XerD
MPKVNRHGKASIISDSEYLRIFKQIENPQHRLILNILRYTGERIGAVCGLKVLDVYWDADRKIPSKTITFRRSTRKASKHGIGKTRQLPMSVALKSELEDFHPPKSEWLFPSPKNAGCPILPKSCWAWFYAAVNSAGLGSKGFGLHSPRRTLINKLLEAGYSTAVIQSITGHESLSALQEYLEPSDEVIGKAIDSIF